MATSVTRAEHDPENTQLPSDWVSENGKPTPWWFSEEGTIVKWTVLAVLLSIFLAWLIGGWIHARVRARKGLPLMGYHSCLAKRSKNAKSNMQDRTERLRSRTYVANDIEAGYCVPPPPIYDPARPPVYQASTQADEEKRAVQADGR